LPRLATADGPVGVRNDGPATTMAAGIALAATWDTQLAQRVGHELGRDARAKGKHFLLGPGVNIYRAPLNGRNFEYFGEDPFLASRIAVSYIKGLQSEHVSATIKHFMGNNSEFGRNTTDSIIDERTMREIYLPTFEAAVKDAHVGSIMDSYNFTNGEHLTQNAHLNIDIAKKDWGFQGIMMSDWGATHDALGAANGGLDLEMPAGDYLNRKNLLPALQDGRVSQATIDDKVRRILRDEVEFGWIDRPQRDDSIPRLNPAGDQTALQEARESMVLLKNDGNLLPLAKTKIKTLAVIGPDAHPAVPVGGGSAQTTPFYAVSFLEGMSDYLRTSAIVTYARGLPTWSAAANDTRFSLDANGNEGLHAEEFNNADLSGSPISTRVDKHVNVGGTLDFSAVNSGDLDISAHKVLKDISTRWTGYYHPQRAGLYDIFVQQGGFGYGGFRLYLDGKLLADRWEYSTAMLETISAQLSAEPHKIVLEHYAKHDFLFMRLRMGIVAHDAWVAPEVKQVAEKADAVVLTVGFSPETEGEGWDRTFALPPGQEQLIREVTAANKNTVVVVTSGGNVDMNAWLTAAPAVVEAWYPGQEGGRALPQLVFGDLSPSGRLPATFEKRWEDNPVHSNYYPEPGTNRIAYKEGVFVGYRGYEHAGVKPLFPFGYGLSYTTFAYSNLAVNRANSPTNGDASSAYELTFNVQNTGKREGDEVAQVYVAPPQSKVPRPEKELKAFTRVTLKPGETRSVRLALNARSFSYYDVDSKQWRADPGEYEILVGRSSEQIELRGKVRLGQ
jgi:beta-glucosidase